MSEAGCSTAGGPPDQTSATGRPALDVRPLAAWWLIFAGIVTALLGAPFIIPLIKRAYPASSS